MITYIFTLTFIVSTCLKTMNYQKIENKIIRSSNYESTMERRAFINK